MTNSITLEFNGMNHTIPVPFKRYLYLLGKFPELIATQISNHQYYKVESAIMQETFDSFKKYLIDSSEPEINSDNMNDFILISQEFQILTDFLSTKIDEDSLNLSNLISKTNRDKSQNERFVSKKLSDIIDKHEQELLKLPINSLINIFYHPERELNDHQKAYDFIIKNSKDNSLFVLLQSLEGEKLNEKSQIESIVKSKERLGFSPVFTKSLLESIEEKKNCYESIINDKIPTLENENKQLKNESNHNIDQNLKLQKENQQLIDEIKRVKEENQQLKDEINRLNELNQNIKNESIQNKDLNQQIQIENHQLADELKVVREEISRLSPSISEILISSVKDQIKGEIGVHHKFKKQSYIGHVKMIYQKLLNI